MLFDIHPESRISYKKLTDADLKRSPDSNQTHIGLSNDSLTFMPDDKKEYSGMLVYDLECDIFHCEIGRITRAQGDKNSPNVKSGQDRKRNVVKKIREYAALKPDKEFYLIWFGLDSGTPLFWLIREGSADYIYLDQFCQFKSVRGIHTLKDGDLFFDNILQYARAKLENVTIDLQKALETAAETETNDPKFKDSEINKARKYIQEIGRHGEEMVYEYLLKEKKESRITDFEWVNQSSEKGRPYDFIIQYYSGLEQWMDVKTTDHEFSQPVIVSKNEINFITEKKDNQYSIFRVYSQEQTRAKLKICSQCLNYIRKMQRDIDYITKSMADYKAGIINYKIAFEPGPNSFGVISNEILI